MLFEMVEGNPLTRGWGDDAVKESLDLCLSCKACRAECPVNVDMATYKAEFLPHYYEGRRRPIAAYAFGLMPWWARVAGLAPPVANFFTQTPGLRSIAKAVVTMAPERRIPKFSARTFRSSLRQRTRRNVGKTPVLFWPDTWNNHFHSATASAAVDVLEAAGFYVAIPRATLCCGRPLYDYGMLGLAKKLLLRTLSELRSEIRAGMSVVGIEPSCLSVFRDELVDLLPNDDDAKRLRDQTYLLPEFLLHRAPEFSPRRLDAKALVHGHCHDTSVFRFEDTTSLLDRIGLDCEVLDSGCCGMAGVRSTSPTCSSLLSIGRAGAERRRRATAPIQWLPVQPSTIPGGRLGMDLPPCCSGTR